LAPHLQLLTLGAPLLITEAGDQIRFRTRKHFALLIRLAVEAGRKLTRDYLMDLLWPDVPAPRARHSLAQALTVLKEKVGRDHLAVQRASIGLVVGAVDVDVRRLDSCEIEIRGPFLDGFEVPGAVQFEQWKDEWRAKLMPRIRDCLVRQMDAGRRIGDFETVEKHARVLLDLDPLSEDGVRGVMEARAWVGDRTNALKVYGRFEVGLAAELGAKPSADLVRIADLLREGRRAAPRHTGAGQVSERQERRFEAETLIGREREFARLYDAWLEVRRREPRIVVLLGDPGVGKTTLTNAFVSTCQMEGAAIARAQAYDAERELPFGVLAELIKQLTMQRAIGGVDPEALSELTRVSPEIFTAFPGVPKPVEWSAEVIPLRLADSFLKAVEAAAEESPLVLVVDDIHSSDNASVAILHVVARKLLHTRLLLILTARSNELRTVAGPSALVSDSAIEALRTLELDPLPPTAAERIVTTRVAKAEHRAVDVPVQRIIQAGNGNPLALELLTKEWLAHGSSSLLSDLEALNTQPVARLGIPRAIGAVFERQIRRLDAPTRAALDLAAVLGRRLADLPLYKVVELSPAAAGEALSRLKEEGILREVHGELEFRNELIRAQAYYAVAGPARRHLHRRVGEVLEGRQPMDGQSPALEIAWHFLRASEPGRALPSGLAGAKGALSVGAPSEAEQILAALLLTVSPGPAAQECKLLMAKALIDQSKADRAMPVLEELCHHGTLGVREFAEATRLRAAAFYLSSNDVGTQYSQAADEALTAARRTSDPELIAGALLEFARSGLEAGDSGRVNVAREELTHLLRKPSNQQLSNAWYAFGFCQYNCYDLRAACDCLEKAVKLLHDSPNIVALSLAHNAVGVCRYSLCEFRRGKESLTVALDLARRMGDDYRVSMTAANLATLHNLAGHFDDAIQFGRLSIEVGAALESHPRLLSSYMNLAEAYALSGDRDRARECVERASQWVRIQRSWRANIEFLCESANMALVMGNAALALDWIQSLDAAVAGREGAVPEAGMFQKLTLFRLAHTVGIDEACAAATVQRNRFRERHPLYYLQVLAAAAWLEKRKYGTVTKQTESELGLFDKWEAAGLRRAVAAQGFID
jgi:DNA-binding SARP family transcriptional activator/tetratricopeptide (TPR) repeat protein/DNA-binding transcriptional ArsR family regulator